MREEKIILFDGAFGTYYAELTHRAGLCEMANIDDEDIVLRIHKEYIDADAMAIKTNTFGANTFSLGLEREQTEQIISKGFEIAKKAALHTSVRVFADIGPILRDDIYENKSEYEWIIDTFLACGASNFLFETFPDYDPAAMAIKYLKEKKKDAYAMLSFAVHQDGYTKRGLYYKTLLSKAENDENIDAYGLNCICGPTHMHQLLASVPIGKKPLSAMPNSGYPATQGGRTVFIYNADYFAQKIVKMVSLGVSIIGGCCGTTPAHIASVAKALKNIVPQDTVKEVQQEEILITARANSFKDKLLSKQKAIIVEMDSPLTPDCGSVLFGASAIKHAGGDAVTFADSPLARARVSSIMIAAKVKRETGIETIPHLTCRDYNLIGIKSVLLGAKSENIDNILLVTGDPIVQTGRNDDKGVFCLNSFSMISYVDTLNTEVLSGSEFFIGAALNVNAANFDVELARAKTKVENGAKFFLTQPIFSKEAIDNLKFAKKTLGVSILAGIMPLAGYKNAVFINNEVPEIKLPQDLIERYKDKQKDQSDAVSVEFCLSIAKDASDYCDGYYIITPRGRADLVCSIIRDIRSKIL